MVVDAAFCRVFSCPRQQVLVIVSVFALTMGLPKISASCCMYEVSTSTATALVGWEIERALMYAYVHVYLDGHDEHYGDVHDADVNCGAGHDG